MRDQPKDVYWSITSRLGGCVHVRTISLSAPASRDGSALSAQRRLKRRIGKQAARALDVEPFPFANIEGDMAIHIERGQFVCAANGEALGSVVGTGGDSFLVESSALPAAIVCRVADIEDVRNGGIRLSRMRDQLQCAGSATLLTEQT